MGGTMGHESSYFVRVRRKLPTRILYEIVIAYLINEAFVPFDSLSRSCKGFSLTGRDLYEGQFEFVHSTVYD